ncbi:maleylpyruvate isomerase family mycothiol-dependent enzyme [Streptomyces spinoverrucosus]|uniref:maleylpyruvate isomerase family mycothiol-dependent enzyme n=1 Tax=Streptomyces spinoverrucosus TaxID=284043 RepID=UPI0018C422FD|nr:maleylpyruvate isomerase family mycothiol-dependent enzyme [Streptomyces spinoverrucosus]MBG0854385.1 maleylpyruvate isomerase family mycothiol-dependent enzyme [Streptomyces spinoverrucosus]
MTSADVHGEVRDPELPGRLLVVERDQLIPWLRGRTDGDFATPTDACPGWTVRDVLAHCSSALVRAVEGRFEEGVFSPESNERDIAERADWTNARVVDELERGMTEAGPVIAEAGGALDGLALGEWVHAGDVREALGAPGAYAGKGLPYALDLLVRITRERGHVPLHADLDDADEPLRFGDTNGERTPGRYIGDAPTLVRLYAGRSVDAAAFELAGAGVGELNIFG